MPAIIDLVDDLGCVTGTVAGDQAPAISAALADYTRRGVFMHPSGLLRLNTSIDWPDRGGTHLAGVGGASKVGNENAFYQNGIGGRVSRYAWWGNNTDPMLFYKGQGGSISRSLFQGAVEYGIADATNANPVVITTSTAHGYANGDTVDVYSVDGNTAANGRWTITVVDSTRFSIPVAGNGVYNTGTAAGRCMREKAYLGIQVNTYSNATNTGKLVLNECSFWYPQTAILFGADMDDLDAASYASQNDNNSDESRLQNLTFEFPYDDNPNDELRTCMRVRTAQGINFNAGGWLVHGNPKEVFYFESGGVLDTGLISLSGCTSTVNPVVLLRTGLAWPSVARHRIRFHIDGGAGGLGGTGGNFRLLQMDRDVRYGCPAIELVGSIGPYNYNVPIIVARGACNIFLVGINNLLPDSIQMIGTTYSGSKVVANVHLIGCHLLGAHPADLVHASSAGPWMLTWSHCSWSDNPGDPTDDYGRLFTDGATSSESTATPSWLVTP